MPELTATRFAWQVLGSPEYPPPVPKRRGVERFGPDANCWLCGGPTDSVGWPRAVALAPTFTNHNTAALRTSSTVCQPCCYLSHTATWAEYAAAHPERGLKVVHPLSWRSYSHVFARDLHATPSRSAWRAWLLEPPEPPFVFTISVSGQKHGLFRSRVSYGRDFYPAQVEEDRVFVDRARFTAVLDDFERLYALGFSKDSILSGQYHHGQLLKVGLAVWRPLEEAMARWRRSDPALCRLAHLCSQRPDSAEETR